jgi:2-polyprenyl-3-methyl-5-hydroxy-6-metoxy-1,4-benzoquinol methylase
VPIFSEIVGRISPRALRVLRVQGFLDMGRIERVLPAQGAVLEVGCGYGHVISHLAELRPDLSFLGVDPDPRAIEMARSTWRRDNLSFQIGTAEEVVGQYEIVLLLHVLHHLPPAGEESLVRAAAARLSGDGALVVNEMRDGHCRIGLLLDHYVSRSPALVRTDVELREAIAGSLQLTRWETFRKGLIGQVLITAFPVASIDPAESLPRS